MAGALAAAPSLGRPAAAQARWGRPFQFAAPVPADVLAPVLAYSPGGAAAAAFGVGDVDTPGSSQGYFSIRPARGATGRPQRVGGAGQVLDLSYDGRSLELLTGTDARNSTCCAAAQAVTVSAAGRAARPRTLVGGLTGATIGRMLTLADGQMLAVVATERGVWAIQSSRANRFGAAHRLTAAGAMPQAMAAAALGGESTIVAWTAAPGAAGAADPRSITVATGSGTAPPRRAKTAHTVAAGHRVDEIGVGPRRGGATVTWVESWDDRRGDYHSQVMASDIGAGAAARALSPASASASGLSFDGDVAGDGVISWQSCTGSGACTAQVATRQAGGRFSAAHSLGAVDPDQPPTAAMGSHGRVVAAWVRGGRPMAAVAGSAAGHFGPSVALSATTYAHDIAAAVGPSGQTMVAWAQGTLDPSVVAAAGP